MKLVSENDTFSKRNWLIIPPLGSPPRVNWISTYLPWKEVMWVTLHTTHSQILKNCCSWQSSHYQTLPVKDSIPKWLPLLSTSAWHQKVRSILSLLVHYLHIRSTTRHLSNVTHYELGSDSLPSSTLTAYDHTLALILYQHVPVHIVW